MMGRVRCVCGRYMRFDKYSPSIRGLFSGVGGTYHYRCTRCQAECVLYTWNYDDEMVLDGDIFPPSGKKVLVKFDADAWEWRDARLIRRREEEDW
jgi:hypothetical protein